MSEPLSAMSQSATSLLPLVCDISFGLIGFGIVMGFIRLVLGPTLPDRVVALDLIAVLAAGGMAVFAIRTGEPIVILVAIVLALIMFVATVAFAIFVERGSTG
jgi:multicomponent Na+:H+ antiporter subunit F